MSKLGRPTKYTPDYCERIIELGNKGYSIEMMASALNISKQRIYDWNKEYPAFRDALARAKELQAVWYDRLGIANLHNRDFNVRLYTLHRMNMHGWNR